MSSAEFWADRLQQMRSKSRLFGNYFATARDKLRAAAEHRDIHHADNAVSLTAIATG